MTEKNSIQYSAVSQGGLQPSMISPQEFSRIPNASCSGKVALPNATPLELTELSTQSCRIVCDETTEDFRLTLCRTFCAGVCPQESRKVLP
jgi:hypothetical protein